MAVHPLWNPYEVPSAEEIDAARVAASARAPETVEVVPPDPAWSQWYDAVRSRVVAALGEQVVSIAHVGSTSVPGLPAKPVVDVDLLVPDPAHEEAWLPQLEAAGFELRVREPEWEEHRCLRGTDPACNLHVFAPDSRESRRHRMFGAWLRTHPADRELYASVKQEVARRGFTDAMLYNNEKAWVIYDLYEKIFAADPEHPHDPHPRPDR
ncbi:GrpB family protein [Nocardioides dongxiaopingii]|uniref:GrpB family protein n=1 Tax=Nocardioides sp. S-1144 TaxID=2582905 RepID=UPI00110E73CB|nr:GrpB family protein [Nocardioides sp. S-1144]QCW50750.1 GrpB family protein [Nocardioides sp. S-1144]